MVDHEKQKSKWIATFTSGMYLVAVYQLKGIEIFILRFLHSQVDAMP